MNKIVTLILMLLVLFSCKKDSGLFRYNQFEGIWEFENFSGYPFNNNYLPPGNGIIIALSASGTYERRQHDTLLFRGRYFLNKQKDCYDEQKKIHFAVDDPGNAWDAYIEINSDKLTLATPNCYQDGGIATYRKIK